MPVYIPDYIVQYVLDNYQKMGNREIYENLVELYPGQIRSKKIAYSVLKQRKLTRTPDERRFLMDELVRKGIKKAAVYKQHRIAGKLRKVGDLVWRVYNSIEPQWLIYLGGKKYQPYEIYLWLQAYGKIPTKYKVGIIDLTKPITIENLHLVKRNNIQYQIGDVLTFKRYDGEREYVKTADDKYELHENWLWKQHHGPIPKGKFAKKIDPNKPITIDNLYLTMNDYITPGVKSFAEWHVKVTLAKDPIKREILANIPGEIERQRLKLQLKAALREFTKISDNAGNSENNQMENPPTKDEE